jgi:hypothetical protein
MATHHQNKEISKAIEYALSNGFVIHPAGKSSHIKFSLYCPAGHGGCIIRVFSTPRSAYNHADKIRRDVDNCLKNHPRS